MNNWVKEKEVKRIQKFEQKWLARIHAKTLAIFLTVVYGISLIPVLWIGCYNYPSADDYCHADEGHAVWLQTHNIVQTLWVGLRSGLDEWMEWMGYFTCDMMTAIPPNVFEEKYYFIVTFLVVGLFSASTIYLLNTLMTKTFQMERKYVWSVIMLVLLLSVQCMPRVARVEAFYWYSGAVNYIVVHAMANFFYGLLLKLFIHRERRQWGRMLGTALLGFFVGGGNQMTMLNVAVILLLAIILISYHKSWKNASCLIIPIIGFYIGFGLNVGSPGNFVRSELSQGMNPIKAIAVSLYYTLEQSMAVWTNWFVLIAFTVIAILAWKMTAQVSFQFSYPLLIILLAYFLTAAMMTPPLYAVGNMEAGRLQAVTYMMFILTSTLSIVYVVGWFRKQYKQRTENENYAVQWALVGALGAMLLGSLICIIPEPDYFTCTQATREIANGSARTYYQEQCERTELFKQGEKQVYEVEPFSVKPSLLFFSDITPDRNDWQNQGLARYLGVEAVVLKEEKSSEKR